MDISRVSPSVGDVPIENVTEDSTNGPIEVISEENIANTQESPIADEQKELTEQPVVETNHENMIDLIEDDKGMDEKEEDEDDGIEVISSADSDMQAILNAPTDDVVAAFSSFFGNESGGADGVAAHEVVSNEYEKENEPETIQIDDSDDDEVYISGEGSREVEEEDDDDDLIVEETIVKTEDEKIEMRKQKTKEFLSWFIRLKPDFISEVKFGSCMNYLEEAVTEGPIFDSDKCKQIAKSFQESGTLNGLAEKFGLGDDQLVTTAICMGILEDDNQMDVDIGVLCDESIDDWALGRGNSFLNMRTSGLHTKLGPLKLMQYTLTSPASTILLLTIVSLSDNKLPCRYKSGYDQYAEHLLLDAEPIKLATSIVDTSIKYFQERKEKQTADYQMNKDLDEFFNELEAITTETKTNVKNITNQRHELQNLQKEKLPKFNDDDETHATLLTPEQRDNLIRTRKAIEAMQNDLKIFMEAHRECYEKKAELHKMLILQPGDFCLARSIPEDEAELTYAVVQELVDPGTYKVKFITKGEIRDVSIQDLALTQFGMYDPILADIGDVGCRVAVRQKIRNQYDCKTTWLSGTTAGRRHSHKGDFLVFLDNGRDTYVTAPTAPTDLNYKIASMKKPNYSLKEMIDKMNAAQIAIMVAQPIDDDGKLARNLAYAWVRTEQKRSFLKSFMSEFPEWPLLRMPLGMRINVMNSLTDRRKNMVTVVGNDRAFAIIRFEDRIPNPGSGCLEYPCKKGHQHRDEMIYRGSHRLEGAAQKKQLILKNNNLSKRRKDQFASQFEPTDMERSMPQRVNQQVVRRAATSGFGRETVSGKNNYSKEVIAEKRRKQNMFTRTIIETPVLLPLSQLKPHDQCGPDCLQKVDADPYETRFHRNSPLHTPLMCGWRRHKYTLNSGKKRAPFKKLIRYFAPCGKPLEDMSEVSDYLRETRSMLTIDCFSFEEYLDTSTYITVDEKFLKSSDISDGLEGIPIPIVNTVDTDAPPKLDYCKRRFQYSEAVNVTSITRDFCSGCSCEGDCSDASKCECQQLSVEAMERLPHSLQYDKHKLIPHYKNRVRFNKVITGMYECNDQCSCHRKACHNRVVQNNIKYPMQIFKTAESGWGCRALTDIPEGTFICNYVGALLTDDLANELQNDDQYFADLDLKDCVETAKAEPDLDTDFGYGESDSEGSEENDGYESGNEDAGNSANISETEKIRRSTRQKRPKKQSSPGANDEDKENEEDSESKNEEVFNWDNFFEQNALYVVDAKVRGNLGRFLNHSCAPNVQVQHVLYDTHDLRLPWVSFFTIKHVKAGDELCWDYGYKIANEEERLACKCGAVGCRGRLL